MPMIQQPYQVQPTVSAQGLGWMWSNGARGNPQPGMMYAQSLVPVNMNDPVEVDRYLSSHPDQVPRYQEYRRVTGTLPPPQQAMIQQPPIMPGEQIRVPSWLPKQPVLQMPIQYMQQPVQYAQPTQQFQPTTQYQVPPARQIVDTTLASPVTEVTPQRRQLGTSAYGSDKMWGGF